MLNGCLNASFTTKVGKVEKILKGSLDSIPSPSVKIQIMGGGWRFFLRCKGKTLLGVLPYYLKLTLLPII